MRRTKSFCFPFQRSSPTLGFSVTRRAQNPGTLPGSTLVAFAQGMSTGASWRFGPGSSRYLRYRGSSGGTLRRRSRVGRNNFARAGDDAMVHGLDAHEAPRLCEFLLPDRWVPSPSALACEREIISLLVSIKADSIDDRGRKRHATKKGKPGKTTGLSCGARITRIRLRDWRHLFST